MSVSLEERARAAGDAVRAAAELRSTTLPSTRTRAPIRVVLTAVVLVVAVTVGVFFAVRAAAPRKGGAAGQPRGGRYRASAVLVGTGRTGNAALLKQDELLLHLGAVPERTATALHFRGTPAQLVARVRTAVDAPNALITVTSDEPTSSRAILIVNTLAQQFVRYQQQMNTDAFDRRVASESNNEQGLRNELASATSRLSAQGGTDPKLRSEVRTLTAALGQFERDLGTIRAEGPGPVGYRLVEADSATALASPHPTGHRSVAVALAVIALLALGGALGFAVGRRRTARRT